MYTKPKLVGVEMQEIVRLNNSFNGNPRYRILFSDGTEAITQSDAMFNYAVPNYRRYLVDVWFTRAGRISHIERTGAR